MFGLDPDPFEQKFSNDLNDGGLPSDESTSSHDKAQNKNPQEDLTNRSPNSNGESFSFFGSVRNVFTRLGMKFGYLKKPIPHPDVLHDFQEGEEYFEFQCMTVDDLPILVENQPVFVSKPEDCSQYFTKGLPHGHAALKEPPIEFVETAKTVFKSKWCSFDVLSWPLLPKLINIFFSRDSDLRNSSVSPFVRLSVTKLS